MTERNRTERSKTTERDEKRAAALRENLKKRKQQQKSRPPGTPAVRSPEKTDG